MKIRMKMMRKTDETVRWDRMSSDLGEIILAVGERGVVAVHFADEGATEELLGNLPGARRVVRDRRAASGVRTELTAYFAGRLKDFTSPLCLSGTPFQERVWKALITIPYGETLSYGDVARNVGRPGGARAVGLACNRNRIAILVPCHRVVGHRGDLVGYGGGLDRKRGLLRLERGGF